MFSLLSLFLMQAAPAVPSPADLSDARCIFLFGYFGSRGTPGQEGQAKLGTMYFVGKVRGRNSSTDFGKLLAAAAADAKRANVNAQTEGARCEREYQTAAIALTEGAKSVNARARP
ncbi:MAG: hypothetical protein JSR79_12775 [Proteobacteria bacterium]|nr:hypothetical protein [Pseudomonadota bacterium]